MMWKTAGFNSFYVKCCGESEKMYVSSSYSYLIWYFPVSYISYWNVQGRMECDKKIMTPQKLLFSFNIILDHYIFTYDIMFG